MSSLSFRLDKESYFAGEDINGSLLLTKKSNATNVHIKLIGIEYLELSSPTSKSRRRESLKHVKNKFLEEEQNISCCQVERTTLCHFIFKIN